MEILGWNPEIQTAQRGKGPSHQSCSPRRLAGKAGTVAFLSRLAPFYPHTNQPTSGWRLGSAAGRLRGLTSRPALKGPSHPRRLAGREGTKPGCTGKVGEGEMACHTASNDGLEPSAANRRRQWRITEELRKRTRVGAELGMKYIWRGGVVRSRSVPMRWRSLQMCVDWWHDMVGTLTERGGGREGMTRTLLAADRKPSHPGPRPQRHGGEIQTFSGCRRQHRAYTDESSV